MAQEIRLTPETIEIIEGILKRHNQVEVKIEDDQVVVIEIRRKKRT